MFRLLAAILTLSLVPYCPGAEKDWYQDINLALKEAKQENKPVLLFFTGSDWCQPCQQFKSAVLDQPSFLSMGRKTFVMAEIDFPEKAKQAAEIANQNSRLAELYHIEGYPTIVLVSSDGRPFWIELGAVNEVPSYYARELTKRHNSYQKFITRVKESKELPPPAAASKLANGLQLLPDELVPRHYRAELERLAKLDPKDQTGYRKRLKFANERAKFSQEMTKLFMDGHHALVIEEIKEAIDKRSEIFSKSDLQMLHLRCSMANLHLKDFDAAMREIEKMHKIDPESRIGKQVATYKTRIKRSRKSFHSGLETDEKADQNEQ